MSDLGDIIPFDYRLKDKRVKLLYTNDPYTGLRLGATGIIDYGFGNLGKTCISVTWDNSRSILMLIEGVDKYEIFD
jgi:hypothetical protein